MESAADKEHMDLPRKVEGEEDGYMEPEVILTPAEGSEQKNLTRIEGSEGSKLLLNLHEAMGALNMLSLASVTIGDYVVVTNSREDVTIAGEPYLALQLWLNVRSGRVISRIWGQGRALQSTLSNLIQFYLIYNPCNNSYLDKFA